MKKVFFAIALFIASFTAVAAQTNEELTASVNELSFRAMMARSDGDLAKAEHINMQAIRIVDLQPSQENYDNLKAELWYDMARYYSLQRKTNEALGAMEKAIGYGWEDNAFASNDQDLYNIRNNKKFKKMMAELEQKGHRSPLSAR